MTSRKVSLLGMVALLGACAMQQQAVDSQAGKPVRICREDGGCIDQAWGQGPMAPLDGATTQEEARIAMLEKKAEKDPRAAFDLALRFFRGDGVRRDSYKSLKWMRDAAERGNAKAQLALGRFYLTGFEEMGADPSEAESWLQTAAANGDGEAEKLLESARLAKKDESEYRRWVDLNRSTWLGYWWNAYRYYTYWNAGYWYYY